MIDDCPFLPLPAPTCHETRIRFGLQAWNTSGPSAAEGMGIDLMRSLRHLGLVAFMGVGATLGALGAASPTLAGTIATSSFSTGDDGWTNGDLDAIGSTSAVTYNATDGNISVGDNYGSNAFVAPSSYLGNQSAAIGGTFTFDLSDISDGVPYSPLALFGTNGDIIYAQPAGPPSSDALSHFVINLVSTNFYDSSTSSPYQTAAQTAVSAAEFSSVISSLAKVAVQADWHSGGDLATLDNVALSSPDAVTVSAAPEPGAWALMLGGVGAMGLMLRNRRRQPKLARVTA